MLLIFHVLSLHQFLWCKDTNFVSLTAVQLICIVLQTAVPQAFITTTASHVSVSTDYSHDSTLK